MKQRFVSLDILKFVAISLLCSCHFLYYRDTGVENFIAILACVGVPLFFMVNGALLMNREFDLSRHLKKTVSLLAVLMVWKILTPVLEQFILRLDLSQYSKSQLIRYICGEDLAGFYTGHFWFMYALLGIYLIFPLIAACINSGKSKGYLILLAGMIGVFEFVVTDVNTALGYLSQTFGMNELIISGIEVFNPFGTYAYCLFYFLAGGLLFDFITNKKKTFSWPLPLLMTVIGWLWIFGLNRYQNTYTNAKWIVVDGYQRIGTVLLAAGIFILVCSFVKGLKSAVLSKIITTVSDNTMGIYYCHMVIGTYFMVIYDRFFQARGIGVNTLKTILFMVVGLGITMAARKIPIVRKLFK